MNRIITGIIITLFSLGAWASLVPAEAAREIARNVYYERANMSFPMAYESISFSEEYVLESGQMAALYVFNLSESRGWVIISAESNAYPVLAYSKKGKYIPGDMPPAFEWWMENYKSGIQSIRDNNLQMSPEAADAWHRYASKPDLNSAKAVTIGPLIKTSWDQGGYYNDQCPGGSVTGCVATAMAQVMRYWSHPAKGKGSHTYTHPSYGPLSADFESTTYNWANMPMAVSAPNADVAKLMFHCGVAVEMNYSPGGSGANMGMAASAFPYYFRYSYFTYQINKSNFNDIKWCMSIRSNIIDSIPVMYAGGSHAFICDGFEYPDHFHFNMGWGGSGNAYFYISYIGPSGSYSSSQTAILGVRPAEESVNDVQGSQSATLSENPELYMAAGLNGALSAYPNPSSGQLRININSSYSGALQLLIKDQTGRVHQSLSLSKDEVPRYWDLDIDDLAPGFYLLEISNGKETATEKIVKL
jgi:hypothetical protein